MQWDNLGLFNVKAIKAARKKAFKARREAKKLANSISLASKMRAPSSVAKPQYQPAPQYRKGMGKEFYLTREWRELRYSIFAKQGNKCQCCGSTSFPLHVDHIKPRSIHPELELDPNNLQILCESCNIGKSNKDATDWRK